MSEATLVIVEELPKPDLMKLAAKAGGVDLHVWGKKGEEKFADLKTGKLWDPTEHDSDAFRLMIAAGVSVELIIGDAHDRVAVGLFADFNERVLACELFADHASPEAAVRMAITFAAAERAREVAV